MSEARPQGVTRDTPPVSCPKYEPVPGSRRCRDYLPNGGCARPDEFMCVEWLKANGHARAANPPPEPTPAPLERDLFGAPYVPPADAPARARPATPTPAATTAPATPAVTATALASFQALGVEVRVESDDLGELWLVPAYTGSGRQELSLDHAELLATLCSALPSARITALVRAPKKSST
jgi:hypothetical protein